MLKKIFDWILRELHFLDKFHPYHFTLDLDHQLDRIFEYRFIQSNCFSFPVSNVELEYMFDTLGFLRLYHDSPSYSLYLLKKLADGLSSEHTRTPRSISTTTTLLYYYQPLLEMCVRGISIVKTLRSMGMQQL